MGTEADIVNERIPKIEDTEQLFLGVRYFWTVQSEKEIYGQLKLREIIVVAYY